MKSKSISNRKILVYILSSIALFSRYCAGFRFPPIDCNPTPRPANTVAIFDSGVLPRLQVISGYSLFDVDQYTYFISTMYGDFNITIEWFPSNSGQVGECKPSYSICTSYADAPPVTSLEDNWIVSSYYESDAITVYVEYLCALITGGFSNTNDCRTGVNIRYYETNDANTVITAADFYSFKQAVITNNDISIENNIYAHFNKSTKGFILGIQNNGFCTALGIFLYYYYQCPAINDTSNLGYLPLTVAPDPSNQPIQVAFQCDNNSENLVADCTSDGSWNMPTLPVCQCLPGFSPDQPSGEYLSCVPCSVDMFKASTGNIACANCPTNSHTNGSIGRIECIYECPAMNDTSNLGYLPLTQAPDSIITIPTQVTFICDGNATSLRADCYANGTWQIPSFPVCQCRSGFSSDQPSGEYLSCDPCSVDMFKATTENSACTDCPANSHTNGSLGQIECIYECPAMNDTSNLGYLPLTQAPDAMTGQPLQVAFICDANATSLIAYCYANGTWQIPSSPVCQCRPGFSSYQVLGEYLSCVPCSVDMFKHTTGNIACTNCPANSHTNGSIGQIDCIYECPAENDTSNLGYLPDTLAPILSNQLIQVIFICDTNAAALMADCYANGTWILPNHPVCECNVGYKSVQLSSDYLSCSVCANDTYKPDVGNTNCTACPTNSHTNGGTGQTECECVYGFYRAIGEPINLACGTSPSAPHNLTFARVPSMSTELTLRWEDPLSLGWRDNALLMYRVSYARTRLPNNMTFLGMTMNNYILLADGVLSKDTEYTLTVTSLNNLNSYSQLYNNNRITVLTTFPNVLPSFDVTTNILTLTFSLDASTLLPLAITYSPINDPSISITHNVSNCTCVHTNCVCTVFLLNANLSSLYLSSTYFTGSVPLDIKPASSINNSLLQTAIIIVIIAIGSIIICCVICIIVLILSCCIGKKRRISNGFANISNRKSLKGDNASIPLTMEEKLYQEPSTLYQDLNLAVRNFAKELDHSKIKFDKEIGSGEFGDVYKGTYEKYNMFISVAIKKLRDLPSKKDKEDFFREASVMGQFNHPNVIYLYGVMLTKPICIVTPYMENGSLDSFVQVYKNELSTSSLVVICSGVAAGMDYLSRIGFVHRDLSARNVLIDSDITPKITDFGLSREMEEDCYNVKSGGKIPVRWTAPEAIAYLKFTTSSDIWSFGVLMWEVLSYGSTPYEGMDNVELLRSVQTGYRLPCPDFCPVPVYELMLSCWKFYQDDRPSFRDLKHSLDSFVDSLINPSGTKRKSIRPNSSQVKTIKQWLHSLRLENYYDHFEENGIHYLAQVWQLTEQDILDIGIVTISHRRRVMESIRKTQARMNLMH